MLTAADARCESDVIRAEAGVRLVLERQRANPGTRENVAYVRPHLSAEAVAELRRRRFIVAQDGAWVQW